MRKKINNFCIKMILLPLVYSLTLFGATYDETYNVSNESKSQEKNFNRFMDGNFAEIIRFEMINFEDSKITPSSDKRLDAIIKKINKYTQDAKEIKVTLIGHTDRPTDDMNENRIDSDTYANKIQNIFRYSLDENKSTQISKDYAEYIYDRLVESNILQDILFVEYRAGKDLAFSGDESDDRKLSNRVMVTIYVEEPLDIDSDRDGVFDNVDRCPNTPRLSKVDRNGCPVDSDSDGIVDYKDKCQGTEEGLSVDPNGCSLKSILKIHFNPNSDKIKVGSNDEIKRFAKFMRENKLYKAKITGHTDSIGKAVTNMKLSQQRARATKVALIAEGVEASRLSTAGRGELDPIESNRLKEGRQANRRIEVELYY